ncbi:hypothetical protein EDB92DRAFT_2106228 [Lactarius akahatsu]|uniref:Uncharacterized protein n=1 Tax=Lactarius akahatsu TaxID=416441 RepID=A0AAD4Q9Q6_9AGAM|nr:hypothetical protein EDB92DRAFT_2106228 [Lactarius akahatsu]
MYDEDDKEEEKEMFKIPRPLDQALEHSLTTQQILTWQLRRRHRWRPVARERGGCHTVADQTRSHARMRAVSNRNDDRLPVSPCGKGKRHPHTPINPRRKRQRVADEREQDDSEMPRVNYGAYPRPSRNLSAAPAVLASISHPVRKMQEMQHHAILQGFCCEEASIGTHGLHISLLPNLSPPRTTAVALSPTLPQPIPVICRTSRHLWPADADADADRRVVPPHPPRARMTTIRANAQLCNTRARWVSTHDPGAGMDIVCAHTNWRVGHVVSDASASADTGIGEYAGDGTIDPPVFGGDGNNNPGKLGARQFMSSATMAPHDPHVRDGRRRGGGRGRGCGPVIWEHERRRLCASVGKGKRRAAVVDGVVSAAAGPKMRRKNWRKALADEPVRHDGDSDDDVESDEDEETHASNVVIGHAGGLTFSHHCRRKSPRPKMRCMLIRESMDELMPQPVLRFIEKWYIHRLVPRVDPPIVLQRHSSVWPVATIVTARFACGCGDVFDGGWNATAVFTVSGEPLCNAFLHGNKTLLLLSPPPPPAGYPNQRRKSSNCKDASMCLSSVGAAAELPRGCAGASGFDSVEPRGFLGGAEAEERHLPPAICAVSSAEANGQ